MSFISRDLLERIVIVLGVMAIIICGYWPINLINEGRDYYYTVELWLDKKIPFNAYWEFGYLGIFVLFYLPAYTIRNIRFLRRGALALIPHHLIAFATFLIFPVRIVRPEVLSDSAINWGVKFNYYLDLPNNCFPSLHVTNAVYISCLIWHVDRIGGIISFGVAGLVAISTLFVKAHYLLDITVGAVLGLLSYHVLVRPFKDSDGTLFRRRTYLGILITSYVVLYMILYSLYRIGWQPWIK